MTDPRAATDQRLSDIPRRALLVGTYSGQAEKELCEEHLSELSLLAETYGVDTAEKMPCATRKFDASTFVTQGKLEELIARSKELEVDLIVFDDEISPAQQRNLEAAFEKTVMDRTEVILEVFAQRAQTKEARLQIELAKTRYQAPRLKRLWTHLSRQAGTGGGGAGGGAYLKGEGEKQIEIDRRLLKKRIERLQDELKEVRDVRHTQRSARRKSNIPVFALVGYTNAGKSTLLNALTESEVFVEDKLFATLDTTTRKKTLSNNQEVLFIDTVGFIRKLPHLLVAAFKSTLEEAAFADILLHVIDASHPLALEQAETTLEVLKELNAGDKPVITVLNKVDVCEDSTMLARLRVKYPRTVQISALNHTGFDELEKLMIEELSRQRQVINLRIPQSEYHIVSHVMRQGHILKQEFEENDVKLQVELPTILLGPLKKYVEKE